MYPKILICDEIDNEATDKLKTFADVETGKEKLNDLEKLENYDCLIVRSATKITKDVIAKAKNLKIIARAGAGLDNVDVIAAKERNIKVVNAPDSLTISVAEMVFGSLLALIRKISDADKSMKEGKWEKKKFKGREIYGKNFGIVGFGRIGRKVATIANGFGANIFAYDPLITDEKIYENLNAKHCKNIDEILKQCDFISIHVPLLNETRNLINGNNIKRVKKDAIMINTSRGGIINESALIEALKNKLTGGACLDVFENEPNPNPEFRNLENVILTPHIASATEEAQKRAGMDVVMQIEKFFKG
ncbi:MAG: hypothetical protein CVT89_05410 [Candidatus Altiarchaeales archaeon HGW-Altiarchaeales-2]|nr:MAG: hypothetical protein CVT89_05410 [Candidatus Altiarchaeales archaeon HGW-Altiarchaeales-2]